MATDRIDQYGAHKVWRKYHPEDDLSRPWVLHHINGDPNDNRIENLKRMTHAEHMTLHQTGLKRSDECRKKMSDAMKASWVKLRSERLAQLESARSKSDVNPITGQFTRKDHGI